VAQARPQQTITAAGVSPFGWVVLGAGVLAVMLLGFVATRPARVPHP
jgi:hypothetical protein